MRPLRLLLALTSSLLAIILISYVAASRSSQASIPKNNDSRLRSLFNWHSPSSLFPPSAVISLTDDNSTFFLARPANFGPLLPNRGFSGQLWIGSGFGDDNLGRGGVAGAEGELGCSDVPGWTDGDYGSVVGNTGDSNEKTRAGTKPGDKTMTNTKRSETITDHGEGKTEESPDHGDGTDDHLHHPLPASHDVKSSSKSKDGKAPQGHADIQSIQESAEIAGKIVLLSRGGCGFLEKVKWVQRRGGTALIVGDNVRGGALVTMYARGDTSNVTIPALFTSHTTAHLLSSLIPASGMWGDLSYEDAARLGLALAEKTSPSPLKEDTKTEDKAKTLDHSQNSRLKNTISLETDETDQDKHEESTSWFGSFWRGTSSDEPKKASSRPPSSGSIDWVLQEDFNEDEQDNIKSSGAGRSSTGTKSTSKVPAKAQHDGFVIGVQDWRDPDLVETNPTTAMDSVIDAVDPTKKHGGTPEDANLKGNSITPGSGQYGHDRLVQIAPKKGSKKADAESSSSKHTTKQGSQRDDSKSSGWLSRLSWTDKGDQAASDERVASVDSKSKATVQSTQQSTTKIVAGFRESTDQHPAHNGLWVTLQPTSISSSPFFDTLLVLVVSPLVTLTVVYALLLLRSRIRRRRWRAPKSVVERLPVRTYHTIASSTGSTTTTTNSSTHSPAHTPTSPDPTTPLLLSGARPIRQRPRSRTAGELAASSSSLGQSASLDHVQEKREAALAEWRRKYGGKQKECVVCLEEYVDGVSRVMSLPCGHEFHAECITPWLTTRRRTCPICKGDVVRSLARASGPLSSARQANSSTTAGNNAVPDYDLYDDDDHEDNDQHLIDGVQEQAVSSRNDDPTAAEPLTTEDGAYDDLERGITPDRTR